MNVKSMTAEIKAVSESDHSAEFTAYASVFGNIDSYNDVVRKGAFAESLQAWEEKGAPIPLLWGHNMIDPDYNIGLVKSAEEDDHGLKVVCTIDTESPKGAHVHRLLKQGRVREMSFAFSPNSVEDGEIDGQKVRYLNSVELHEVSVVPLGANPETEILAVKSPTVIPEALMERLVAVLEDIAGESTPPDDEESSAENPDPAAEGGAGSSATDSNESGEDDTTDPEEEDDEDKPKADLARLETMFRAIGRD